MSKSPRGVSPPPVKAASSPAKGAKSPRPKSPPPKKALSPRRSVPPVPVGRPLPPNPNEVLSFPDSFSQNEVDLVMAQTNCSQATAFLCLKQANGDVIDALLAVSSHEEENRVEEEGSSIEVPEKTLDDNAELIMAASSCSKETALKALEKYDGDVVNALLGLQELSEGSLTEDLSLSTEKQTDRRILILEELNASEQTYCNGMSHLQTYFIYEILTWSENGEKEIFAAFKSVNIMLMKVIALNMPMAERFNSCLEEYRENGTALIGPAFEGIERFGEDYSNYIEFTQQLFKNMDMWEKNNAAFIAIVKELNNKAKQDKLLDLRSYLIMPVQRCPRYLLFLKDLARSTPTEHADFKHIKDAHTKTEMVNRAINRHLQDASNSMKMKELSKQFATDPNLISPHRKLLKEGLFQKKCEKNSKKKSRKIFLFNDMLAYAKPFGSKFKLCEKFPLRGVRVEEDPEATEDCAFMIRTPAKNFTFFADSMEEKMEWMLGITNAAAELKMNPEISNSLESSGSKSPMIGKKKKEDGKRSPRGANRTYSFTKKEEDTSVKTPEKRSPLARKGSLSKSEGSSDLLSPTLSPKSSHRRSPRIKKHSKK